MVNAQVPHDGLDGGIVRAQSFLQGLLGGSIGDDESCFLVVDFEADFTELCAEFMPCCHHVLGQCVCIVVAAVKSDVVHPSIEMKLRALGLERAEDGLQVGFGQQGCLRTAGGHALGDVEPVAELRIGNDSLGPV